MKINRKGNLKRNRFRIPTKTVGKGDSLINIRLSEQKHTFDQTQMSTLSMNYYYGV